MNYEYKTLDNVDMYERVIIRVETWFIYTRNKHHNKISIKDSLSNKRIEIKIMTNKKLKCGSYLSAVLKSPWDKYYHDVRIVSKNSKTFKKFKLDNAEYFI